MRFRFSIDAIARPMLLGLVFALACFPSLVALEVSRTDRLKNFAHTNKLLTIGTINLFSGTIIHTFNALKNHRSVFDISHIRSDWSTQLTTAVTAAGLTMFAIGGGWWWLTQKKSSELSNPEAPRKIFGPQNRPANGGNTENNTSIFPRLKRSKSMDSMIEVDLEELDTHIRKYPNMCKQAIYTILLHRKNGDASVAFWNNTQHLYNCSQPQQRLPAAQFDKRFDAQRLSLENSKRLEQKIATHIAELLKESGVSNTDYEGKLAEAQIKAKIRLQIPETITFEIATDLSDKAVINEAIFEYFEIPLVSRNKYIIEGYSKEPFNAYHLANCTLKITKKMTEDNLDDEENFKFPMLHYHNNPLSKYRQERSDILQEQTTLLEEKYATISQERAELIKYAELLYDTKGKDALHQNYQKTTAQLKQRRAIVEERLAILEKNFALVEEKITIEEAKARVDITIQVPTTITCEIARGLSDKNLIEEAIYEFCKIPVFIRDKYIIQGYPEEPFNADMLANCTLTIREKMTDENIDYDGNFKFPMCYQFAGQ